MNKERPSAWTSKKSKKERTYSLPQEVVDDPSLSSGQKRAILSEWASDASAVEGYPALRWLSGTTFPVTFSAVMDAREQLDHFAKDKRERARNAQHAIVDFVAVADFERRKRAQRNQGA